MAVMRPIGSEDVQSVVQHLARGRFGARDVLLFVLGCETGYRVSALLSLRVDDVIAPAGTPLDEVTVSRRARKGGRAGRTSSRTIPISPRTQGLIREWVIGLTHRRYMRRDVYLFQSFGSRDNRPITRERAWQILSSAGKAAGLTRVGTHSMRKTFAARLYDHFLAQLALGKKLEPARAVQAWTGHKSLRACERYLPQAERSRHDLEEAVWA